MLITTGSGVDAFVQLITVLLIFVFVLAITLFVTKWVAGFQRQQMTGSNMQVIDTMRLTPNQFVQIVKIGSRYFALAISKEQVTLLAELDESDIIQKNASTESTVDFASVLKRIKENVPGKITDKQDNDEN